MKSVRDDSCEFCYDYDYDEDPDDAYEDDEFNGNFRKEIAKRKYEFIKQLTKNALEISDVSKITICRDYFAWGEFGDYIADNDGQLCELAAKVNATTGEEQKVVLKEMRNYINTSNGDRQGESFGCGFDDFRYHWDGDDNALIALSQGLCSGCGTDICEGIEYQELDLTSGAFSKYAEFKL